MRITIAIVVLGLGAIAAWLFWWKPEQEREAARVQVTEWESKWLDARRCILGDTPLAAEAADALALAELATGSMKSNASDCTGAVKVIVRPPGGEATEEVERAFAEVEAAIPAVAKAYAFRISSDPDEIDRRVVELGVAIDALDAAHDRLRSAAGLAPIVRTGGTALHRLPAPVALRIGEHAVEHHRNNVAVGHDTITGSVYGDTEIRYVFTGPTTVTTATAAVGAIASTPRGAWMTAAIPARAVDPKAQDGQLAAVAMPSAPTLDHAAAVQVVPTKASLVPIAALGDGDERAVLLVPDDSTGVPPPANDPPLRVAISSDGGKTWRLGPDVAAGLGVANGAEIVDVAGLVEVWADWDPTATVPTFHLLRFDAAHPLAPPVRVTVPRFQSDRVCRQGAVLWGYDADTGVVRVAGSEVVHLDPIDGGYTMPTDCTADALLVEESGVPTRYHRCTRDGCKEAFRGSVHAYGRVGMLDDGRVVYAAGRGKILALWTEGVADPTYYKLTDALVLQDLVTWDGVPYALLSPEDSNALYAVPLKV
jgi:hypothetical protein